MKFLRDTFHLWILFGLLGLVAYGFLAARSQLVPKSFGEQGPYRAEALTEIAAKPSVFQADNVCHQCHEAVQKEREHSLHKAVSCVHCHGLAQEHVALAREAAKTSGKALKKASAWDGDFRTSIDLYITRDRKACLACHEAAVGMPEKFKKIDVAKHLEDQGASDPKSRETCFECHKGHNTAP